MNEEPRPGAGRGEGTYRGLSKTCGWVSGRRLCARRAAAECSVCRVSPNTTIVAIGVRFSAVPTLLFKNAAKHP